MTTRMITEEAVRAFHDQLVREEKSPATVEKYLRDVRAFLAFAAGRAIAKELVMGWKESLLAREYAAASINSMLASLNSLLDFFGWGDCKVKKLKVQRQAYASEDRELTRPEYKRLLAAAKDQPQLQLIMETICGTGIRVSELQYFTVEAVKEGKVSIRNKGKTRAVLLQNKLKRKLLDWAQKSGLHTGAVFVTRTGKPLDRSNIWARMKRLCHAAGVKASKVFPHNLRKLFARCFYALEKDIAKLADILGHSDINTTRIYIMTTGTEHRRQLERLDLIL